MRSLQSWLTSSLVATLVLLFSFLWLAGSYALGRIVEDQIATRLQHDLEGLIAALEFVDGKSHIPPQRLNPVFRQPFSGHYFTILTADDSLRSPSLWDEELPTRKLVPGDRHRLRIHGPDGQKLLLIEQGVRKQERNLSIAVAEDLSPAAEAIRRLLWGFAGLSVGLLGLWIYMQRWIVARALKPLQAVSDELIQIHRGERSTVDVEVPTEVAPLVEQINRLTDLTGQRLKRHRVALGNLAHALKTPLTVLSRVCDNPVLDEAVRSEIDTNTRRISRLVDRELKRARIAGSTVAGQRIIGARDVGELIDTLKKIYRDKRLDVTCDVPAQMLLPGERDDMFELFGNVLDNAFKWARSRVCITVNSGGSDTTILIEDDGPGCNEGQIKQLAQRGVRIDESTAGSGLGLAIASEIVSLYGGEIGFGRSASLGGFQVRVVLPVPQSE